MTSCKKPVNLLLMNKGSPDDLSSPLSGGYLADPIDWEEGKIACGGKAEVFLQKVEDFDKNLNKAVKEIYNGLMKDDFRLIRTHIRNLCASLAYNL